MRRQELAQHATDHWEVTMYSIKNWLAQYNISKHRIAIALVFLAGAYYAIPQFDALTGICGTCQ